MDPERQPGAGAQVNDAAPITEKSLAGLVAIADWLKRGDHASATRIGQHVYRRGRRHLKPQAFARPGASLLSRLEAAGLARRVYLHGGLGLSYRMSWELTEAGYELAATTRDNQGGA